VNFQSAGTLWLDDLSLSVGEHPVAAAAQEIPVVKGNLVQSSGFELGLAGWTMPERVAIERGGVGGGRCAHWLNKRPYMLEGRPVALKPGQRYTFSAFLRAPSPGTVVGLSLREVGGDDALGHRFTVTNEWRRYSFSFTAQPKQNRRYFLSLSKADGADFLADNVQLEEGELTEYAPVRPTELALDLPRGKRFPTVGQTVPVEVVSSRTPGAPVPAVSLVATDYLGNEVARHSLDATKPTQKVALSVDRPGFVSLALLEETAGHAVVLDEAQLCVLDASAPDRTGAAFFGAHGTEGTPGKYHALTAMAKAGARSWRLHDLPSYAQWFMVEPEKGKFVWYDGPVDAMREQGMEILGVFCRTPEWAGRDPDGEKVDFHAWPPRDWDEFATYVYRTVAHYKAKIKHWEVWNEPWGRGFWAGTPEEYAKLLEVAYTQAKRADPECVIVGGCFWPAAPEFTDRVLATGALKYMDAVSYHHYCEPDACPVVSPSAPWSPAPTGFTCSRSRARLCSPLGRGGPCWHRRSCPFSCRQRSIART
ncbi:MAG: hypothetical protein GW867_29430, partial [Armatimonadetes bacterium]|nr:hypothetical protein [Armatimonadota bacterium]